MKQGVETDYKEHVIIFDGLFFDNQFLEKLRQDMGYSNTSNLFVIMELCGSSFDKYLYGKMKVIMETLLNI